MSASTVRCRRPSWRHIRNPRARDFEQRGSPCAALGIAGNEHHEQKEVDDQEGQQHELDRKVFWKGLVIPEDRTHHERDEQERDVRLEVARPDRFGVSGDQTAIGLSGDWEGVCPFAPDCPLRPSERLQSLPRAKNRSLKAFAFARASRVGRANPHGERPPPARSASAGSAPCEPPWPGRTIRSSRGAAGAGDQGRFSKRASVARQREAACRPMSGRPRPSAPAPVRRTGTSPCSRRAR